MVLTSSTADLSKFSPFDTTNPTPPARLDQSCRTLSLSFLSIQPAEIAQNAVTEFATKMMQRYMASNNS